MVVIVVIFLQSSDRDLTGFLGEVGVAEEAA
jgi:hypothetical protein